MSETTTTEIEFKDSPARLAAAQALSRAPKADPHPGPLPEGEGELSGEKMILNMGPSHPATHGVLRIVLAMDVGALTVFLHTFTEREKIYNLCESLTGARFTTSYMRIGGLARDLPPGWVDDVRTFLDQVVVNFDESEKLLTRNRIFVDRTR